MLLVFSQCKPPANPGVVVCDSADGGLPAPGPVSQRHLEGPGRPSRLSQDAPGPRGPQARLPGGEGQGRLVDTGDTL